MLTLLSEDIGSTTIIYRTIQQLYGRVLKGYQQDRYEERYFATDLINPGFVKLADAYGATVTKIHTRNELIKALGSTLDTREIHLIEAEMPEGFADFF